jgi:dynein heavy chain
MDDFFKGVGPQRIFVYYQTQFKISESGEIQDLGGHDEFFVSDGEKIKLKGKGVYFVRTTPAGKQINLNSANDNEVLFGEISEHTVTSLNTIINQVYKPLVDKLDNSAWGVCEDEQKREFNSVFEKFASELKEALKSL